MGKSPFYMGKLTPNRPLKMVASCWSLPCRVCFFHEASSTKSGDFPAIFGRSYSYPRPRRSLRSGALIDEFLTVDWGDGSDRWFLFEGQLDQLCKIDSYSTSISRFRKYTRWLIVHGFVHGFPCGDYVTIIWLVVWNMTFIFPYIGNNPPNWLIFFRGGWNHQPGKIDSYSTCTT